MKKTISSLILFISLAACQSAKQYNTFNDTKISANKLHKDIDYLQRKFIAMHPNVYLYTSQDSLQTAFETAKNNITSPLTPKEFYAEIAPVIASVKQGHSRVTFPSKKITKKQNKAYKNTRGPLSQFTYLWYSDSLYLSKAADSTKNYLIGSQVLEINGIKTKELFTEYKHNYTGDGLTTGYLSNGFNRSFNTLVFNKIGMQDTLHFVIKSRDSLFTITNIRQNISTKNNDSIKRSKVTTNKYEKKTIRKQKKILGWDNGSFIRELIYPIKNDSTFAVLKITKFRGGSYKKAYDSLFSTIKNGEINHLVLDVKNNPGGAVAEINTLYQYLKLNNNDRLLSESKINSRSKFPFQAIKGKSFASYIAIVPIFIPTYTWLYFTTKKDDFGYYQLKIMGPKPKPKKDNAYNGKLSVLVNGGSFSASCIITSNLQGSNRAKIYGEETSGTFNGTVAGIMPLLKLPNSKLRVRTGLIHIKPEYQSERMGRGIIPDIEIKPNKKQLFNDEFNPYLEIYNLNK